MQFNNCANKCIQKGHEQRYHEKKFFNAYNFLISINLI